MASVVNFQREAAFRTVDISVIPCSCRPRLATTNLSNSCTCGLERLPSARNDTFDDSQLCSYTGDSTLLLQLSDHFPAREVVQIFCKPPDEHRIVTDYLKEISEEFYVIDPPDSRPLKVVIKGLPISTEIDEIQEDLTSQGFSVEKVAQLTRSKTKSPLPIFMVELEKKSDSPDIFKMKKCCCLTVQIDAFNRRPGVSQCYNCNLFNHSSKNCFMRTRCLKCGESHRTNECPIKEKIENPVCINCNKTGHMANWSQCEEFPKRKLRKGETIRNRNTSTETNKTLKKVTPNLSFAAALSGASNKNNTPGTSATTEETPSINEKNNEKDFGFKDVINELRRFFLDYPFLLEMDRNVLHSAGLKARTPRKKLYISEVNRKRSLEFAMKYKNKPMYFWKKVIFSDESKFEIFTPPSIRKIWRKNKTALELKNVLPTLKYGGRNVMVWGCVAHNGAGNLVFIANKMNALAYIDVLRHNFLDSAKKLNMENTFIFQQDINPKHTAIVTRTWLLYHAPRRLETPAQSPDLNPIENLWMHLDTEVQKKM
ncbi:transposable element Tcb1 transposase [Trichonephila clavipes]|nr:transposable element Tcb1 transposase [Trichonephila clavipes]